MLEPPSTVIEASVNHVRALCRSLERIHAPAYYAAGVRRAWKEVGLKGYWMGYFGSRAAPMGAVAAATVEATFPSFASHRIRRAIPDAWGFAAPDDILAARDAAMARVLAEAWDELDVEAVAGECRELAEGIDVPGARSSRPLYAANAAREWSDDPHLVVFHASTMVREYRGDTHMALLVVSGLDGIEANVLAGAGESYDRDWVRESRGWSDPDWEGAVERLVERGWITSDEEFTVGGRAWRDELENRTDELVAPMVERFGDDRAVELTSLLEPLVEATLGLLPDTAPHQRPGF